MPGRRRDGRNLWAAERDEVVAPSEAADVDVNPKQRKVLDVQTSAGNAAATAMVQRQAKTADKQFEEMSDYLREAASKEAYAKTSLEYQQKTGGKGGGKSGGAKSGGSKSSKEAAWAKGGGGKSGGSKSGGSKGDGSKSLKEAAWAKGGGSKSSKDAAWAKGGGKGGGSKSSKDADWKVDGDRGGEQASIWADAEHVYDESLWKGK